MACASFKGKFCNISVINPPVLLADDRNSKFQAEIQLLITSLPNMIIFEGEWNM